MVTETITYQYGWEATKDELFVSHDQKSFGLKGDEIKKTEEAPQKKG